MGPERGDIDKVVVACGRCYIGLPLVVTQNENLNGVISNGVLSPPLRTDEVAGQRLRNSGNGVA